MKLLDNFLTSGHEFGKDEHKLKSIYILTNSFLLLIIFIVSILTIMLLLHHKLDFAIDNIYYIMGSFVMYIFLRIDKKNYLLIIPLIPLISLFLVAIAISKYPNEQVRVAWFLIIIIASFFLGGKKLGVFFTILSILTLAAIEYYIDTSLDSYTFGLAIVIILLGTFIVNLYENRELTIKNELYLLNNSLEAMVQNETEKLKKQKNAYRILAHYDTLTSLPNRTLFYEHLKLALSKAKRNKKKLALLFIDLDNFKEINDLLGHHLGDEVLLSFSKKLKKHIRDSDILARLGGDEFTLVLDEIANASDAGTIAQNLRKIASEPLKIHEHEFHLTISIGISIYPNDSEDMEELIKCADTAMYSAKRDGRNLVHFYESKMTNNLLERLTIETYIRRGIDQNEFEVYYQPVVNENIIGGLAGLEALVRWRHPKKGLQQPGYFIPIAEASSLIVPLGEIILSKVADDVIRWHTLGFDPNFVSVNLSVKQLSHNGLLKHIEQTLRKIDFRDDWLELEITESYTFQKPERAIRVLNSIRDLGIKLSIDDFGTGYSSLSYLKKLPISKLKIDQSFVRDIPGDSDDETLVRTIIAMGQNLNLEIVAEGVENKKQKKFLRQNGCYLMQGYLFDKPVPAHIIEEKYIKGIN